MGLEKMLTRYGFGEACLEIQVWMDALGYSRRSRHGGTSLHKLSKRFGLG